MVTIKLNKKLKKIRLWFTKNKGNTLFSVTIQFHSLDFTPIAAFAIVSCKILATVFLMYKGEGKLFAGVAL